MKGDRIKQETDFNPQIRQIAQICNLSICSGGPAGMFNHKLLRSYTDFNENSMNVAKSGGLNSLRFAVGSFITAL
jgi:hypothetical protein